MKHGKTWMVALVVFVFLMVALVGGCKGKGGPPPGMTKDPSNAKAGMMDATGGKGIQVQKADDASKAKPAPKADEDKDTDKGSE
jgi:hypothetical protein